MKQQEMTMLILATRSRDCEAALANLQIPVEARFCGGATFTLADPEEHIWSFEDNDPKAD